jgi:hypothetical protein
MEAFFNTKPEPSLIPPPAPPPGLPALLP